MGWIHAVGKFHIQFFCIRLCQPSFKSLLSIAPFDYPLSVYHTQDLTELELVEMPSSNLVETVHNKWLQQSSNRGTHLYVASVDDYVRALMQAVRYTQYLKGKHAGTSLGKEELLLRVAQRLAE
jgi:hypothetical protein